jgi:hypothetical protein
MSGLATASLALEQAPVPDAEVEEAVQQMQQVPMPSDTAVVPLASAIDKEELEAAALPPTTSSAEAGTSSQAVAEDAAAADAAGGGLGTQYQLQASQAAVLQRIQQQASTAPVASRRQSRLQSSGPSLDESLPGGIESSGPSRSHFITGVDPEQAQMLAAEQAEERMRNRECRCCWGAPCSANMRTRGAALLSVSCTPNFRTAHDCLPHNCLLIQSVLPARLAGCRVCVAQGWGQGSEGVRVCRGCGGRPTRLHVQVGGLLDGGVGWTGTVLHAAGSAAARGR